MKILGTGSKGVIGNAVKTKAMGKTVFGVDLTHYLGERGFIRKIYDGNLEYARCDISEYR